MADELTNESQNEEQVPASSGSEPVGVEPASAEASGDLQDPSTPPQADEVVVAQDAPTADAAPESDAAAPAAEPAPAVADAQTPAGDRGQYGRGQYGRGQGGAGRRGQGGRGGRGPRDSRDALEGTGLEEVVVKVYRCATVVKGGRRFSFAALVVVGDRQSRVGVGYGKANEVPSAVDKARKAAQQNMINVKLAGTTIPHRILSKYRASKVLLMPAGKGTGVIAGASVRAVMELAGIKDVLTKVYGSTGPKNLVKAAFQGLASLRSQDQVAKLRGVPLT